MSHTSLPTTNYHQREGGLSHVTYFKILGPLPISGTAEGRNLKFGMWLHYARYKLAEDKLRHQTMLGHGQGMILATSGNCSRWASANISSFSLLPWTEPCSCTIQTTSYQRKKILVQFLTDSLSNQIVTLHLLMVLSTSEWLQYGRHVQLTKLVTMWKSRKIEILRQIVPH